MAATKGEEAIVLESEGRKRANEENDSRLAKKVKVEGEAESDGTKEEDGKVERLRRLLADDPKKLSKKDVEEVINCLNVEEIISLALEPRQGKGSDDDDYDGEKWEEGEEWRVKALDTVRLMLGCIELVNTSDIRLVYEKWPPKAFAAVLFSALDSYGWGSEDPLKYMEYYDIIPKLCGVLPFKLFAHILDEKDVFSFHKEIDEEVTRRRQKKAAKDCGFCSGEAEHTGMNGEDCTLMKGIPIGTRVPAGYWIKCEHCGKYPRLYDNVFEGCFNCDCETGQAVPIARLGEEND